MPRRTGQEAPACPRRPYERSSPTLKRATHERVHPTTCEGQFNEEMSLSERPLFAFAKHLLNDGRTLGPKATAFVRELPTIRDGTLSFASPTTRPTPIRWQLRRKGKASLAPPQPPIIIDRDPLDSASGVVLDSLKITLAELCDCVFELAKTTNKDQAGFPVHRIEHIDHHAPRSFPSC